MREALTPAWLPPSNPQPGFHPTGGPSLSGGDRRTVSFLHQLWGPGLSVRTEPHGDTPSGICSGLVRTLVQFSWTITGLHGARGRPPSVASSHTPWNACTLLHTNICCLHSTQFPGKAGTQEHPEHPNMIKAPHEALL